MPLTLLDYERLAKRSRGQAHVLMLEVLNRRTFLTGFFLFYAFVGLFLAEIFAGYWLMWQCQTICGNAVPLSSTALDIGRLKESCGSEKDGGTLTGNTTTLSIFRFTFVGTNHTITALDRYIQWQLVFQNPLPEVQSAFTVYFNVNYFLSTPVGHQPVKDLVLRSTCFPGHRNCFPADITHIDSPWNGNYSLTLSYSPDSAELLNGTAVDIGDVEQEYGAVLMCHHHKWYTLSTVAVRYILIGVLLAFMVLVLYHGHWPLWGHWIPEQCWSIALVFTTLAFLNPLYAALVFISGPDAWGFRFLQVMEYQVRYVGPMALMAFEIVVLSSCQGIQTFIFGIWYCPSVFAILWAVAALFMCWLNAGLNGSESVLVSVSLVDLPPLSITAQFLCSWGLIVLYGVWYAWFLQLCLLARDELHRQPYLSTRCRQLTLRLVILWWVPKEILYATMLVYRMTLTQTYATSLISDEHTIVGELVLEVLNAISIVLMFMPAARQDNPGLWKALIKRGTEGDFLLYESETAQLGVASSRGARRFPKEATERALGPSPRTGDRFCVETAMIMYNLAFEVYMAPPIGYRPVAYVRSAAFDAVTAAVPRLKIEGAMSRLQYLLHCLYIPAKAEGALPPPPAKPLEESQLAGTPSRSIRMPPATLSFSLPSDLADGTLVFDRFQSQLSSYPSSMESNQLATGRMVSLAAMSDRGGSVPDRPTRCSPWGPISNPDGSGLCGQRSQWHPPRSQKVTFVNRARRRGERDTFAFEDPTPAQIFAHPYTSQLPPLQTAQPSLTPIASNARMLPVMVNPDLEVPPLRPPPEAPPNLAPYDLPAEEPEGRVVLERPTMIRFCDVEKGGIEEGATEQDEIARLEALLRAKQHKKKQRILNQVNMDVGRYGYRLMGVISRDANQAMVVACKDHVGVSFRGTANTENIRTDLKAWMTMYREMVADQSRARRCLSSFFIPRVHKGFYAAWKALRVEMLQKLAEAVDESGTCKIYISGHSLGGAIATLAAYEVSRAYPDHQVVLYTFGSPRVGNVEFCRYFDKQVPCMWRIENEKDVVPTVPPTTAFYHHAGKLVRIDGDGLLILQPSYLESLHYSRTDRLASHHLSRYRKGLEAICQQFDMSLRQEVVPYGQLWEAEP
eukprot:GGOE01014955.1.p1 GENE.GGOE01014955.1~~GGOE01014955.1.p1  ORF type:complete len:1132 (+),score=268.54 GGOE01014955.1:77-3472(+)